MMVASWFVVGLPKTSGNMKLKRRSLKIQTSDTVLLFTLIELHHHSIILGDSNTQHIKFGSGKGTLGAWMPGKRVTVVFPPISAEKVDTV